MSFEAFGQGDEMNAAKGRAVERDFRMDLEDLAERHRAVTERIAALEERLKEGNAYTLQAEHPSIKKTGMKLGGEIAGMLEQLNAEKAQIEARIKSLGGRPA